MDKFETLTSVKRVRVFIVDDSVKERERSKKVELLARIYDHVSDRFIRGFNLLTLGWSDGFSFVPVDGRVKDLKQRYVYQGRRLRHDDQPHDHSIFTLPVPGMGTQRTKCL